MERILLAAKYPNLTELKIFNFEQNFVSSHFKNESSFQYIFQEQITDLILGNSDRSDMIESSKNYTKNVYEHILIFFKKLKCLNIIETFNPSYPPLSLCNSLSTTFFSSTRTHLCINIYTLDDCLYLLDGRLKQLSTLIDILPNLKCFSFKCYLPIQQYDQKILPLLRRMLHLEKLTLYFQINQDIFIDSTHLENEIFHYMSRIHSYTFYISTYNAVDSFHSILSQDNQRIITNIRQQSMASIINYIDTKNAVCHIFSLPFLFDHIEYIGNIFPDTVFTYVTYLLVEDIYLFHHDFFIRIARSFPLLNHFRIVNIEKQPSRYVSSLSSNDSRSDTIAKYHHLTLLNLRCAIYDYVEEFLNETKAYVPCLNELAVSYNDLRSVTNNFTREETRRNCAKIKRLHMIGSFVHSKEFYLYFPLL